MPRSRSASKRNAEAVTGSLLLKQAMIQEIAVSPDGAMIVYSRRTVEENAYRTQLWRVPFAGGAPEPLTSGAANDGRPRFSPDGRSLLFVSDRGEKSEAWVLPLGGGEARKLADLPGEVRAAEWSPDGERVLLLALNGKQRFMVGEDEQDPVARVIDEFNWRWDGLGFRDQYASAFVVAASGGEPVRLTDPGTDVLDAAWSPDGERIGFVADREPDMGLRVPPGYARVWAVPADGAGAEPELLGKVSGALSAIQWGATGLAAVGVDMDPVPLWASACLYVLEADGPRQLGAELDRPVQNTTFGDLIDPSSGTSFDWLDGESIVAVVGVEGAALPYRFGLDGAVEALADGEIVCSAVACGGGKIAVVATDRGIAGEVYAVEDGALRRITTHGSDWLEPFRRDPVRIRVPHADGHTVDTWFIEGRNAPKPGPIALQIHGGPHGSHGPTPWLEMLALADAGIHVIYTNPRGSTGYGEAFANVIHGQWGGPDASDHMAAIDWAIREGIADPARVGVFGLSGGGYMTAWLLGHEPGRFAAAVAENPVTDLISMFAGSDLAMHYDERFVGVGQLPENIDAFLRHSPFMYLHRNEAPLLLIQCEGDRRCPPMQSEMAFHILKSRGRTVQMVRYPDESHYLVGYGRPDRRVDRLDRIVDWMTTYL